MTEIAAIILAAGRASRFRAGPETSKVVASLDGVPLIAHAVAAARASRASRVLFVTGHAAARTETALAGTLGVTFVHNANYASGLASSLKAAIAALPGTADGALVVLGDMPLVRSATLDRLIEVFERERPDAVVPVHAGRRGNPVLIGRSLFARVMALSGDAGARRLLAEPGRRIATCDVDDPGVLVDIDTPDALAALQAALRLAADGVAVHTSSDTRSSMSRADSGGAKK